MQVTENYTQKNIRELYIKEKFENSKSYSKDTMPNLELVIDNEHWNVVIDNTLEGLSWGVNYVAKMFYANQYHLDYTKKLCWECYHRKMN
jgi:hypothetical protein